MSEAGQPEPALSTLDVRIRPAAAADVPRLEELLTKAHLPSRLIVEFLDGFLVAEQDGRVVGGGGIELYDDTAVLRSVVVDEALRGAGIGRDIAAALIEDARGAGAADLYLFTIDSWPFWQKLGFVDVATAAWRPPARRCWQYRFVTANAERFREMGIHSMWRNA